MTTTAADRASLAYLSALAVLTPAALELRSLLTSRDHFEILALLFPAAPDIQITPFEVDRDPPGAGKIRCERLTPPAVRAGRHILYCHGGSYVMGSTGTARNLAAEIGRAAQAEVITVDYRRAPEHPFSSAVRDMLTVYYGMLAEGVPRARIAFAGDSAGGGLAIALLAALREAGLAMPAAAYSISPWADLALAGASVQTNAKNDQLLTAEMMRSAAALYLDGVDPRTPLASPVYADLSGLPPLFFQVGSEEILLDDATRLAEHAHRAGVSAKVEVWKGMQHDFQLFCRSSWSPVEAKAREAIDAGGAFLRAVL